MIYQRILMGGRGMLSLLIDYDYICWLSFPVIISRLSLSLLLSLSLSLLLLISYPS